jgi:hypothetical protein
MLSVSGGNDVYPGATLSLIFDRGNKNEGQLNQVAKRALVGLEKNVKDVSIKDDEELPPLRPLTYWHSNSAPKDGMRQTGRPNSAATL